jgi:hypothetical protein
MPSSALVEKIYIHVCVRCECPNCTEIFIPDTEDVGNDNPSDPIDAWAMKAAVKAEKLGWKAGEDDAALCPLHASRGIS